MGLGAGTAAIVGGSIGAAGSLASGLIGSSAATSAADTQAAAANRATQATLQQQALTRGDLAPFRTAGTDALASLRLALGLPAPSNMGLPAGFTTQQGTNNFGEPRITVFDSTGVQRGVFSPDELAANTQSHAFDWMVPTDANGQPISSGGPANPLTANGLPGLTFNPTQAALEATPGYQFNLSQGERGVENSASAQGRGISGAALKGAAGFATGLASSTLDQQQRIFQTNLGNVLNPLTNLVNMGEGAAATTGQLGASATSSANQFAVGGANATAAGQVGSAGAIGGALGGAGNSASNFLLFNALNGGGGFGGGANIDTTTPLVG